MLTAPLPTNEEERLRVLRSFEVLDTGRERAFDDLAEVASHVCGTPIALISLVDAERQWFKARVGLEVPETPRDHAFCAHAILRDETMVVADAKEDQRFRDNPLVLEDPNIRFYAGSPLRTSDGHGLGTLCVIDSEPRVADPLNGGQVAVLEALSRQVVRLLELRRAGKELADALSRVRLLAPLVPVCAWCRKVRDDGDYWTSVEVYLREHAGVAVTHGICPTCAAEMER